MFIGIALIATYFVAENFGCAALQVWLLRRGGSSRRWMEAAVFLWAFLMSSLFLLEAFEPPEWKPFLREWLYFPMAVEMVWNVLLLQVFFPATILAVILALRLTRDRGSGPAQTGGMSRRRFLYLAGCGAVRRRRSGWGCTGR